MLMVIAMILISGLSLFGIWVYFNSKKEKTAAEKNKTLISTFSRPEVIPIILFFLVQIISGSLIASTWLNLHLISSTHLSKFILVVWIASAFFAPVAIFLIIWGVNYFKHFLKLSSQTIQNWAFLLLSFLSAILIGLAASGLVLAPINGQSSPFAGLDTYLLGVGLPYLFFDLNLAVVIFLIPRIKQTASTPPEGVSSGETESRRKDLPRPVHGWRLFLSHPLVLSLLITIPFFIIFLVVFRPGYGINDDFGIISLASGYLGGKPVPYLTYSNVLLGFILNPLYELHTNINWLIIIFLAVNFLAVASLLYVISSLPLNIYQKLFGILAILICDGYFLINITFTIIAAFASIAGLCLVLTACPSGQRLNKGRLIWGALLTLMGSLIRIESCLLALIIVVPSLVASFRSFHFRNLVISIGITTLLVVCAYEFDRGYVRSSPSWNTYDIYNQTRSMLHDTPRIENMAPIVKEVGWNENDLVLFTHWFFPDPQVYSLQHLQYLVEHVSDKREILSTIIYSAHRLVYPGSLPYILIIFSTWLGMLIYAPSKKVSLPLFVIGLISLLLIFYLSWAKKLPDRVLLPLLAAGVIFGLFSAYFNGIGSGKKYRITIQDKYLQPARD